MKGRIYADLQKTDGQGRILLTTIGTSRDLRSAGIGLRDGMRLRFYSDDVDASGNRDDLVYEGVVRFDDTSGAWVAEINWNAIHHESELCGS